MAQSADYRKNAQDCIEIAQTVRTPEQRATLMQIADTWLRLADNAERGGLPDSAPARQRAAM